MCFTNHLRDSGIQRITLQWPSGQSLRNPFPVSESLGKSQFSSNQLNEIIASRKNIFAKWSVQIIDFLTDFFLTGWIMVWAIRIDCMSTLVLECTENIKVPAILHIHSAHFRLSNCSIRKNCWQRSRKMLLKKPFKNYKNCFIPKFLSHSKSTFWNLLWTLSSFDFKKKNPFTFIEEIGNVFQRAATPKSFAKSKVNVNPVFWQFFAKIVAEPVIVKQNFSLFLWKVQEYICKFLVWFSFCKTYL